MTHYKWLLQELHQYNILHISQKLRKKFRKNEINFVKWKEKDSQDIQMKDNFKATQRWQPKQSFGATDLYNQIYIILNKYSNKCTNHRNR